MRIGRLIVPTGISLAVHALILGLAALATWTITRPPPRQITTAELALDGLDVGERGERDAQPQAPEPAREPPDPSVLEQMETLALPDLAALAAPVRVPSALEVRGSVGGGVGGGDAARDPVQRAFEGVGSGGRGGGATFAGVASERASSVVFVVDCSGSMVSTLSLVVAELERSIGRLAPDQRFAIVPFRDGGDGGEDDGGAIETFPSALALVPATDRNLERARAFLRTLTPRGRSDPMAGLEPALALEPQAVFLLARSIPRTEGTWGDGREGILARLEALNPMVETRSGARTRPAQISAIQFLETDPLGIMQAIGATHGRGASAYTVLTPTELGRAAEVRGPSPREIAADLDEAARLLGALGDDRSDLAVLVGWPTEAQRARVARDAALAMERVDRAVGAARLMAEMAGLREDGLDEGVVGGGVGGGGGGAEEPRAVLLGARAALLRAMAERFGPGMESAREAHLLRAARAGALIGGEIAEGGAGVVLEEGPALALAISTWALAHGVREEAPSAEVVERYRALRAAHAELWDASMELGLSTLFVERGSRYEPGAALAPDAGPQDAGVVLLVADAHKRAARVDVGGGGDVDGGDVGGGVREGADVYARFLGHVGEMGASIGLTREEREAIVRQRLAMLRGVEGRVREREPLEMLDLRLVELDAMVRAGVHDMESLVRVRETLGAVEGLLGCVPSLGGRMVVELAAGMVATSEAASVDALEIGGRLAALVVGATEREERDGREEEWWGAAEVLLVARARQADLEPSRETLDGVLDAIARVRRGLEAGGEVVGEVGGEAGGQTGRSLGSTMRASLFRAATLMASGTIDARWEDAQGYALLRESVEMEVGDGGDAETSEIARAAAEVMRALDAKLAGLAMRSPDPDRQLASMRASALLAARLGVPVSIGVAWAMAQMLTEMGEGGGEASWAVEACRVLVAHPEVGREPDGGVRARVLLARAQKAAGDGAGSLETLLGLAEGMNEPRTDGVGSEVGSEVGGDALFWEVWTRTLEGMMEIDVGGGRGSPEEDSRRAEVARHVVRLGLIDEALGGEPWRTRLRALAGE